jgi:hypothetical protein
MHQLVVITRIVNRDDINLLDVAQQTHHAATDPTEPIDRNAHREPPKEQRAPWLGS